MSEKKLALLILDGWGIGDGSYSDAVAQAHTPVMDELMARHPWSKLHTSGLDVGLPPGQMGNSEVGHLNIGAGRVVYQDLVKINLAIENKLLDNNPVLQDAFRAAKNGGRLHIMGLVSDGCIHSSHLHLHRLIELAQEAGVPEFYIHAFTDGRDTDPKSGIGFIGQLLQKLESTRGKLASLVGRYYAMDRDRRWERIKRAYDLLVHGIGEHCSDITASLQNKYDSGERDEFIQPLVMSGVDGRIRAGDVVICFNYRTDRCREITHVLTQADMPEEGMLTLPVKYVTMTNYDDKFKNVEVIFHKDDLASTLGEVLADAGKTQLRIAETEKYPHVTFFFSGGREAEFVGESRIMVPSPKVATYDLQPEMSAAGVRDGVINAIREYQPDFICLNFANPDMVGHTGVYSAIIKAVETVDSCLGNVISALEHFNYSALIVADHGNADYAVNPDGSPNTAHTVNPVPCILIDNHFRKIKNGKLADLAPTILRIMNVEIPSAMSGEVLVEE